MTYLRAFIQFALNMLLVLALYIVSACVAVILWNVAQVAVDAAKLVLYLCALVFAAVWLVANYMILRVILNWRIQVRSMRERVAHRQRMQSITPESIDRELSRTLFAQVQLHPPDFGFPRNTYADQSKHTVLSIRDHKHLR